MLYKEQVRCHKAMTISIKTQLSQSKTIKGKSRYIIHHNIIFWKREIYQTKHDIDE